MAHESGPHRLLAVDQLSSRPGVPSLRRALSGRAPAARLLLLGSVSGDGPEGTALEGALGRTPGRHFNERPVLANWHPSRSRKLERRCS